MAERRNIVSEMIGRIRDNGFGMSIKSLMGLWGSNPTVDYSRNDYELYKAIYYAATLNGKGTEYLQGAGFAKPIINSSAAFVVGSSFNATIDNSESNAAYKRAEEKINAWIKDHKKDHYDLARIAYRGGDAFELVNEDGEIEQLDPDTVEIIYNAITGQITEYRVKETVKVEETKNVTFVRRYGTYFIKYERLEDGQKVGEGETLYEVYSTTEGLVPMPVDDTGAAVGFDQVELVEMPLPVIHYANEPEPKAIYGNSDLQNCLIYFQQYSSVLSEAVKNNIYNATPIPVITGLKNKGALKNASNSRLGWGRNKVLYLEGDNADAKFLTTNGIMEDTGKLLEYLFYLIVQSSETPEFVLGTAVSSSKASTETQLPVVVKKTERKRAQLTPSLKKLVDAYVYRQMVLGDPDFYAVFTDKPKIDVSFPPILDEDKKLTLDTITFLKENAIISDETALELSVVGERIQDPKAEIEAAREDAEVAAERTAIYTPAIDDSQTNLDENGNPIDDSLNADGSIGDEE